MIFFTSDHHFGHANILKYCDRPFFDVDDMNAGMLEIWNSAVSDSDEIWYLGDAAMGDRTYSLQFLAEAKGRKFLIPGNHDLCWKGNKSYEMHMDMYYQAGFERIMQAPKTMLIADREVNLHHFPYINKDSYSKKFDKHSLADDGKWLIHGHVHQKWRTRDRMINVSVDVWNFEPVPITAIEEIIRSASS